MNTLYKIGAISFLAVLLSIFACKGDKVPDTLNTDNKSEDSVLVRLNRAIKDQPNNANLYHQRSNYYYEIKDIQKAFRDIQQAIDLDQKNANYYVTLADLYFENNKFDEAKKALIRGVQLDDQNESVLVKLGEHSLYLQNYSDADSYLKRVINLNDKNAKAYFLLGFSAKESKDTSTAILAFQKSLEANQDYYEACIQLGILFDALNNPLAENYYKRAIEIKPSSTEARYNLGMHYQRILEVNKAIETYTELVDIDPGYKYAHFNMGYILIETQAYSEAKKHFNNAVLADPNYAEGYYGRAYCHEVLGDVINAELDYKKALELRVNYQAAIEGLNRIQRILKSN